MSDTPPPTLHAALRAALTKPTEKPVASSQKPLDPPSGQMSWRGVSQSLFCSQNQLQAQPLIKNIPIQRIEDRRSAVVCKEEIKASVRSQNRSVENRSHLPPLFSTAGPNQQVSPQQTLSIEGVLRRFHSKPAFTVEDLFSLLNANHLHVFHPPPHMSQLNTKLKGLLEGIFTKISGTADCTVVTGEQPLFSQVITKFPKQNFPRIQTLNVTAERLAGYYKKFPNIKHLELINCEQAWSITQALKYFKKLESLSIVSSLNLTSLADLSQAKETLQQLKSITLCECPKVETLPSETYFSSLISLNLDASVRAIDLSDYSEAFRAKVRTRS